MRSEADGALVAHIRGSEHESTLRVFYVDGALRFTDNTTYRGGGRSQVPERWLNNLRSDLRPMIVLALNQGKPVAARDAGDPAERLRQLKTLLDRGLITQAEYDAKRAEILKGL